MRSDLCSGVELYSPLRSTLQPKVFDGDPRTSSCSLGDNGPEETRFETNPGGSVWGRSEFAVDGMPNMPGRVRWWRKSKSAAKMQPWVSCEVHWYMAALTLILPELSALVTWSRCIKNRDIPASHFPTAITEWIRWWSSKRQRRCRCWIGKFNTHLKLLTVL